MRVARKLKYKLFGRFELPELVRELEPDKASDIIYNQLIKDEPCMIARFGAYEISVVTNYLGVKSSKKSILNFIRGVEPDWWWNKSLIRNFSNNAGFFPIENEKIERFSELMIFDMKKLDVIISWQKTEYYYRDCLENLPHVGLLASEPYWSKNPWTRYLKGKKVLVIHPFSEDIENQYTSNREFLFKNPDVLPEFELTTIKAVQSIGGESSEFNDWFEALDWMKSEIDKVDFDVCLLGCGAYGFPLAAHVKSIGKKAVHLGGSLQLLFGIWGSRWESDYSRDWNYTHFRNEYWVRPAEKYKPNKAATVEDGCYW